uniref:Adenine deaminase n=1 Tax=Staphylothermus marinus TaxID=2280 RepID=A0A7C4HCC7_STAMA
MKILTIDLNLENIIEYLETALGRKPADIIVKNVNIVQPHVNEIEENKAIIIKRKRIVSIVDSKDVYKYVSSQTKVIEFNNEYAVPGFIDLHIHIESSLLDPFGFSKLALKHGTTTVLADPHELANVLGLDGIKLFIEVSKNVPLKILINVPSCIPPVNPEMGIETALHRIGLNELKEIIDSENVYGLGEVMDYKGVVEGVRELVEKVLFFRNKGLIVDGHAPKLTSSELCAYISTGIVSDHEATDYIEGLEKIKRGMWLYIREGSAWRDLGVLIELIKNNKCELCLFVSDDLNVYELFNYGHMDRIVNKAIEYGLDPVEAIKYATLYPAIRLNALDHIGLIAPGRLADLFITKKIECINPHTVISNGELIYYRNYLIKEFNRFKYSEKYLKTVNTGSLRDKIVFAPSIPRHYGIENGYAYVNTIRVSKGSTLTKREIVELEVRNTVIQPDFNQDVMYIIVADRHLGSGDYTIGFIKGLGFKAGAIAQTIAHDTHNLIIAGWNSRDMEKALIEIENMQGGIVVVDNNEVVSSIQLKLAGLMSIEEPEVVYEKYSRMITVLKSKYGLDFEPFYMSLSLVSLPVIPEIRITTKGLIDVNKMKFITLVEDIRSK